MAVWMFQKPNVCDIRPELTSKAMFFWAKKRDITLRFIQSGKPTQNAFVESFNRKYQNEFLNQHWFRSLDEARRKIKQ